MSEFAVLIVDDDQQDRYLLRRQLKEASLDIDIFEMDHGKSALDFFNDYHENKRKYANKYPPLIIFLDINMPLINGHEFLAGYAKLRDKYKLDSTIIMMFTSSILKEDKDKALEYDFVVDYLVKGEFDSDELKEKIKNEIKKINKFY